MRILHVDGSKSWRGGQNQALITAAGMTARGHDVTLVCRSDGALFERARAAGLFVKPAPFHGELAPGAILDLIRNLRNLRPDIVQAHDPPSLAATAWAARLTGFKRIIATRRVDFPFRSALSRWKFSSSARVIAVSHAIADVLKRNGVPEKRIRVVYEGVPGRPALPGGDEALRELGVPDGAPVVGNVAALTDHKDHDTLLEAAARVLKQVPHARFVVLGEGERRSHLERRILELGLVGRFILAGFRADVDCFWPRFSIFCLSSHMEGLGTSVLDAMAFGLPVVATEAGGIPEAVLDGVTGRVVAARRPDVLANALTELLVRPERCEEFGRAARRRYERRFTDARMIDETLRIYEELM
ncbi:MAG: glycosyltransferase [Vicinamibacteria bacterium]|nr:glycosyltransferase [Vicinamibacteria bacterium]